MKHEPEPPPVTTATRPFTLKRLEASIDVVAILRICHCFGKCVNSMFIYTIFYISTYRRISGTADATLVLPFGLVPARHVVDILPVHKEAVSPIQHRQ
jgi:hypothetical protein